jgi:glycosyltransferase involved in cell wall biosynthesis
MRLRILHTFFYPSTDAVSQIISELAFHLAQTGHHVEAIATSGSYLGGADHLPAEETVNKVRIRRCWGPNLGKRSLLTRAADIGAYVFGSLVKALSGPRADVVLILSSPPMYHALAPLLKGLKREKYVFVVMDLYPDIAAQAGLISKQAASYRILRQLTAKALRRADRVIVLGRCMADVIRNYGIDDEHISIVENWAIGKGIRPVAPQYNSLRGEMGYDDQFVMMYSGNMGIGHRFDDLLHAAEALKDRDDIRFCFVGNGVRRSQIEQAKAEKQLDNLSVFDYAPRPLLPYSLTAGDAHFVSLREGFEGLIVPSKAYGVLAAGRPILYQGSESGEIARMVRDFDLGFVVGEGDTDAMLSAITTWADNPQLATEMGNRCWQTYQSHYTRHHGLAKYQKVLESVADTG